MTFDEYNESELYLEKYSSIYEEFRRCWETAILEAKDHKVVMLTTDTIKATRQWFADNAQACINEAVSGQVRVNNLTSYVADQAQRIQDCLAGRWDHTLAFQQRVLFIQTGVCHAILP